MARYITAVSFSGGKGHPHIAKVMVLDPATGVANVATTESMVAWVQDSSNEALVGGPSGPVKVGWVRATPPYLRTHADKVGSDNLLALPTF